MASILGFLSPNPRVSTKSAKPSFQRGRRFRRPSKPARSKVLRILTETNMNSRSTRSTKSSPNQIHPKYHLLNSLIEGDVTCAPKLITLKALLRRRITIRKTYCPYKKNDTDTSVSFLSRTCLW